MNTTSALLGNSMGELMNGSVITAVDTALSQTVGPLWYAVLFGVPIVMVYLKTESLGLPMVLMMWTISFYGYLIDPTLATLATITMAAGFAILLLSFWRDN